MGKASEHSIHETDFCGHVASAANVLFAQDPTAFPFVDARVEGFGTGAARRKRKDLRFYESREQLALCGEVKLPGTPEGRSPYDEELVTGAHQKADNAGVQYFFTWNVNVFVLWDRSQWDRPLLDRRVREWRLGVNLTSPEEVAKPYNLEFIRTRFLPDLLRDLADICTGRRRDWTMPPDDIFIRSLESHLDWPVQLATGYLIDRAERNKAFDAKVQQWLVDQDRLFVRNVPDQWHDALNNMAKTLAYVWANRLIFYKALRARFTDLPRLEFKRSVKTPADAAQAFDRFFERAVQRSGDYEPLLFPNAKDWAAGVVFEAPNALDAWRGLLRGIESVDFQDVSSDIVGRIFQKLIGPEERHRYGQHFTGDDVVDLINAFCIRNGSDTVLDPACGSGSFLVRAYYRKRHLSPTRDHLSQLADLFGCDIALYPAHLATLNLAAREINEEANYPRIVRRDFFDIGRNGPFCTIPDDAGRSVPVHLPTLDAVVGNPPYVRQERIEKSDKQCYSDLATRSWSNGLHLTGRADLHCYFWPVATKLLKADGYFGFLTSSSWLDVEYGFALQGWILRHFKLVAVMESAAEPWFPDARVKTAVTVLKRCESESERMTNPVRFVRFDKPLKDIIGVAANENNERDRQASVEQLRDRIVSATSDEEDDELRIIVKRQRDLWNDGVRAGSILRDIPSEDEAPDDEMREENDEGAGNEVTSLAHLDEAAYFAGKWGRYVRAPDFYFEIMRRFRDQFVALGEAVNVRYGVKTGCDAFFMPRDITDQLLHDYSAEIAFRRRAGGAPRKEVVSGKIRIVQAGDGSVHPIEAEYLAPEVHSLMKVDRPLVRSKDLDRAVLLVDRPIKDLRGTWVYKYLKYGEQATFPSNKSKPVPVPQRSYISKRAVWYDLTRLIQPSFAFWPKGSQYRHIVIYNPDNLIGNCRLNCMVPKTGSEWNAPAFAAVLNSTLAALWSTFYGRYTGTEGAIEMMVTDVTLTEVPNPNLITKDLAKRLHDTLRSMSKRKIGPLCEQPLLDCHSLDRARRLAAGPVVLSAELRQNDRRSLDDAVFETLGVRDANERAQLVQRLHEATALHFRHIRVVEIEKQEQRSRTANRRFSVHELAADAWDAAELPEVTPLVEWLCKRADCTTAVNLPDERPAVLSPSPMFDPNTVYFGKSRSEHVDCPSQAQAELIVRIAELGVAGWTKLPAKQESCVELHRELADRIHFARTRFNELAESRTSDPRLEAQIIDQLIRWFVLGRVENKSATSVPGEGQDESD